MSKGSFTISYDTKVGPHTVRASITWRGAIEESSQALEDVCKYIGIDPSKVDVSVQIDPTLH